MAENKQPRRSKFDEVAADLDDLALDVDELNGDHPGIDRQKLEEVKSALDRAKDVIDDIAETDD
jgi:hypothetical protein